MDEPAPHPDIETDLARFRLEWTDEIAAQALAAVNADTEVQPPQDQVPQQPAEPAFGPTICQLPVSTFWPHVPPTKIDEAPEVHLGPSPLVGMPRIATIA